MITVKIIGGLGNQMFQYALGRNLARTSGAEVKFDVTGFKTYTLHKYGLEHFNIKKDYATEKEAAEFQKYNTRRGRFGFLYNKLIADTRKYVKEINHSFNPEILETKDGVYLDGYWQSEKYFLPIEQEIRETFTPSQPLGQAAVKIAGEMAANESVSFHVRRGNYVTNKKVADVLGACDPEYYRAALTKALLGLKDPHVFVFSDDIAWVKENMPIPCKVTFVSDYALQDWEELILMSRCTRHILSNSSFSWWGAWLDPNPNKMVIAPAQWFKDPSLENKDITPSSWIRL